MMKISTAFVNVCFGIALLVIPLLVALWSASVFEAKCIGFLWGLGLTVLRIAMMAKWGL